MKVLLSKNNGLLCGVLSRWVGAAWSIDIALTLWILAWVISITSSMTANDVDIVISTINAFTESKNVRYI